VKSKFTESTFEALAGKREIAFVREPSSNDEDSPPLHSFDELQDGKVYEGMRKFSAGQLYSATQRNNVEDKLLEVAAASSVRAAKGANAHEHSVKLSFSKEDGKTAWLEIDALVHVGGENIPSSSVYIIEASFQARAGKVDQLRRNVAVFKTLLDKKDKQVEHYLTVPSSQVFGVLAAKKWKWKSDPPVDPKMRPELVPVSVDECRALGLGVVEPSGAEYAYKKPPVSASSAAAASQ